MPALNILVLEDNPLDTELMLRELGRAGLEPTWWRVDNEADYLARLHGDLDLIISDYQMPQFNGMRALELLKARRLDIPFILVSGTIGEDTAVEAMRQGATDYLLKDRLTRLGSAIQQALAQSRLRKERKAAAATLRLREIALNAVSQGVLITDENRRIIYANTSFTTLTGYSQEEIQGRPCTFLQGPDTDPGMIRKIRAALDAGAPFEGEILNYRKNGEPFWNDLSLAPIRAADGEPLRFIGIQRNVTARKRAGEDLRRKETELRVLFDLMPAMISFKDTQNNNLRVNKTAADRLGKTVQEIEGRPCADFQPQEAAAFYAADLEVMRTGVPQLGVVETLRDARGEDGWLRTDRVPYCDEKGKVIGIVVMSQDITEDIRAEEKVRLTAERLQLAAKAGGIGIWELDCASRTTTWDDQMFTLYGQPREGRDSLSARWGASLHPADRARVEAELAASLRDDAPPFDTEFRIIRKTDGATRFIRSIASLLRDESGHPWRMIGTNLDVTEERAREHALAEALAQEKEHSEHARAGDRAKGEFLAVMSHEIRTPLNGILGFSELLARTPDLPATSRDYVETIASSGEALLRILNDVLDYSRLKAGQVLIEKTRFAPRETLEDIRALLAQQARDKGLAFEVSVDDAIPGHVLGDCGRLRQILLNLAGNAIKFTEKGGVTMGLRPRSGAGNYEFFVRDTGCGIPPDQIEYLFQPFTQADSSISRRHGGSGLGLSISRRLAELLGGSLTMSSEPGHGSEFRLAVTLGEAGALAPGASPDSSQAPGVEFAVAHPLHILVVEDDRVNLKLMLILLRRLGYAPLSAGTGREAVETTRHERPDCVLMDLQMPEMDGIEATKSIRSWEATLPGSHPTFISALTANIVPTDRQRCHDAGMNGYLNKPVNIAILAAMLTKASAFVAGHHPPGGVRHSA